MPTIPELVRALGVDYVELPDWESLPDEWAVWGDNMMHHGANLMIRSDGTAVVCVVGKSFLALHEACHALIYEDENMVMAFEYLVAKELEGEEREKWVRFFCQNYMISSWDTIGAMVLTGTADPDILESWEEAFDWLEEKGFTHKGRPVFGVGQGPHLHRGVWNLLAEEEISSEF